MINIKDFDSSLLKLDKKLFKNIAIYYFGYTAITDKYEINSANRHYLLIYEIDGFIEEKEGNKYVNIAFTDSNSEVLRKYAEVWRGIRDQIKKYMKIK